MPIAPETLRKWDDIHRYQRRGWIYRGQQHKGWKLETSLERCCKREKIEPKNTEEHLLRDFKRVYHQYVQHIPKKDSKIEWLSLMQHHGAPTRLLDFTYSIYVAAYFALENAKSDCAVWAVNGPWALKQAKKILRVVKEKEQSAKRLPLPTEEFHEQDYNKLLFDEPFKKVAFPLNPFRLNERLLAQHGTFMAPGNVSNTFMENIRAIDGHNENCIKIVIPYKLRKNALERLFNMNISRTSLFPGLDGYAQSLGVFHSSFRSDPYEQMR